MTPIPKKFVGLPHEWKNQNTCYSECNKTKLKSNKFL